MKKSLWTLIKQDAMMSFPIFAIVMILLVGAALNNSYPWWIVILTALLAMFGIGCFLVVIKNEWHE